MRQQHGVDRCIPRAALRALDFSGSNLLIFCPIRPTYFMTAFAQFTSNNRNEPAYEIFPESRKGSRKSG
jgi:hypothetical protein